MSKKVKRKVHSLTNSSYENDYSPPNDQRFGRGSGRRRNSANLCGAERFEGRRHDNTETGRSENRYPKPPFKEQQQPWPGLASKMDPRPDHGEKSYKGSGRLAGRKALITGGDSGMGRGAAIPFAREDADVALNYFPTEQPDADEVIALIKEAGRKAVAMSGDLREENFCKKTR